MKKVLLSLSLCLLVSLSPCLSFAATGCSYPTSLDAYSDKSTGDFLTTGDINSRSCAIEKLESGPLAPNVGSVAAPAYAFRNDMDTGMYWVAANEIGFSTGNSRAMHLKSSRVFGGNTTGVTTGSNSGDFVAANTNAYRFLNLAGTSAADYGIISSSANDLLLRAPASSNKIQLFAGGFQMVEFLPVGDGNGSHIKITEASTDATCTANAACIYAKDNGSGKTQLCVKFGSGATQCFATEP